MFNVVSNLPFLSLSLSIYCYRLHFWIIMAKLLWQKSLLSLRTAYIDRLIYPIDIDYKI